MRRAGMVAVLVSAACGRVSFGELSDAGGALDDGALDDVLTDGPGADVLLGHDEDGDGVPDASDPCPHLPETTQSDLDGDLVGDSCDREPSVANQQWQLFHPLTTGSGTGFTRSGSWTVNADDWSFVDQTNPNQLIRSGFAVTDIDVWVGVTFEALAAGGRQGAIIVHSGAASPYYYGELFEFGSARVNLMEYDGTNYTAIDTAIIGGTFPLGYTTLHLRVSTMPSQEFLLQADTPVGPAAVNFATPNYTGAQNTIIGFGNTTGRLHYIAIVATN